jgi:hypothetical protein
MVTGTDLWPVVVMGPPLPSMAEARTLGQISLKTGVT